jgi:hypothetical protein
VALHKGHELSGLERLWHLLFVPLSVQHGADKQAVSKFIPELTEWLYGAERLPLVKLAAG